MKVYLETYGCQMNVADSELIIGLLVREGYQQTDDPAAADLLLVNTCAVRDNAEQRIIGRLGEFKRHKKPGDVVGVVGCMAQRLGPTLLERAPHVDLVVGPDGYRSLPALVAGAREGHRVADVGFKHWEHYEDVPPARLQRASAFVTVQRGCDYRCTFCIVPMTRGPERSRILGDVVREVESLVAHGVTEVTLLGQTVNSYHDGAHDFADLLRAVGAVPGVRRLRFTSPHPNDMSDRVIEALATVPAACEYVHLPLQSGSSRVLKRMLRRYTREGYLDCVRRLRQAVPAIALSTDIIVGFPGETDADFAETLSLVETVGFDDAYTFIFSPRDGTPATRLPGAVPAHVAGERLQRLVDTVRAGARRTNLALVGTTHEVLVEGPARRGNLLQTRTRTNKIVLIEGPRDLVGTYLDVRLTGTTGSTFSGVPVAKRAALKVTA